MNGDRETMHLLGQPEGWYAGHYCADAEGMILGGDIFTPNLLGYLGNAEEKPRETVPDAPFNAHVYYWNGATLSSERPRK